MPENFNFEDGAVILVNKPLDWTSFDVVNKLRFAIRHQFKLKKIKVGHAGTLDPRATGLLIICTGKYTKLLDQIAMTEKSYTGTIKFGAVTASYDSESPEEDIRSIANLNIATVEEAAKQFIGEISQFPPVYSAIKIKGEEAYKLVRRGAEVEMKPRNIEVFNFELTKSNLPYIDFYVKCSKGTYIRSLAHDLGQSLGVGAYLYALCRTSVGGFYLDKALSVEDTVNWIRAIPLLNK